MPDFIYAYNCEECPCLSNCHDENYCNLNYTTELFWTENRELIYCSFDCKLVNVNFNGGSMTFEIDDVKVTNVRPEHW